MSGKIIKRLVGGLRILRYRHNFLRLNHAHESKVRVHDRKRKQKPVLSGILETILFFGILFFATIGIMVCLVPEIRTMILEFMRNQLESSLLFFYHCL